MQEIQYKYGFSKIKLKYARGIIEYRGKTIQEMEITGFGVGIMDNTGNTGGLIGYAIRKKNMANIPKTPDKNFELETLGKHRLSRIVQLIIGYKKPHEEKVRGLYIPLNINDPVCMDFLTRFKQDMRSKYIGVGNYHLVSKELKISHKIFLIIFAFILIFITAVSIFATIEA